MVSQFPTLGGKACNQMMVQERDLLRNIDAWEVRVRVLGIHDLSCVMALEKAF